MATAFSLFEASAVTKRTFDFVVGVDGDFRAAKAAAEMARDDRFYIFFPNGSYDIGNQTGDGNQRTAFSAAKVSLVGQSMEGVTLFNTPTAEGISTTATIDFQKSASLTYLQDLTFQNKAYYDPNASANRFVAVRDQGDKNIFKNVRMLSTQDTYYTPTGERRSYLENCEIHGTVDYICGGGDLYFNQCLLVMENRQNNCLTAPATKSAWGYVFQNCTIDGHPVNNGSYRLGRSWQGTPRAVFLNTRMNVVPRAEGWGDPMNVCPTLFAEYNSMDGNGNAIDLSRRKGYYTCTKDGSTASVNPRLSYQEATKYTIENVLGGSDGWRPDNETRQMPAPHLSAVGSTLVWDDMEEALCYFVFKNGVYQANVAEAHYEVKEFADANATYSVRAANAMGGLGAASAEVRVSPTEEEPENWDDFMLFHYDNGTLSSTNGTEFTNQWDCNDPKGKGYAWAITGRNDKSVLYGNDVKVNLKGGETFTTFKNSNGAQNRLYLPENTTVKSIVFIGYSNATDGIGALTEINGKEVFLPFTANTETPHYQENPSVVKYDFEEMVCGSFTFTFSTKQICFVALVKSEPCECPTTSAKDIPTSDTPENNDYYDLSGRKTTQPMRGKYYVRKGEKVFIRERLGR